MTDLVLAILPIKSLDVAKSRLSDALTAGPRRALVEAMFADVLTALRRCDGVDRILVVSSDHSAQRMAGGHGADVIEDDGTSHSRAAAAGIEYAIEHGYARALLVPGDCPLLSPADLDTLLALPRGGGVAGTGAGRTAVIVPDRHGTGTNALLLTPPDALTPAFGEGSRARHLALAREAGTAAEVADVPTLMLDVDTPDDLAELQRLLSGSRGGAAHTRGMLNQLQRSRA